jgi:hypothetical protein
MRTLLGEAEMSARSHLLAVGLTVAAFAVAIVATYAALPAGEFYHVSHVGLAGGASRALVFSNFPTSLIALALIGVSLSILLPLADDAQRRLLTYAGIVGAILCLVTALPGVVDQGDLDAKLVNVVPLFGVVIAAALTMIAAREPEAAANLRLSQQDRFGRWLLVVLAVLGLPWILADVGVYVGDLPVLGSIFYSKQIPVGETLRAVHLGHHHGLDGLLFVFVALTLGRVIRERGDSKLAGVIAAYLGLMLSYGLANFANDFWQEQLVKRGWTDREIPNFLRPERSLGWGLLLVGAVICWAGLFRPTRSSETAISISRPLTASGAPR